MTETEPKSTVIALRVPQAARAIGIGERLLWKMIAAQKIPVSRIGRCTVVHVEDLDRFVRENRTVIEAPAVPTTRQRDNAAMRRRRSA